MAFWDNIPWYQQGPEVTFDAEKSTFSWGYPGLEKKANGGLCWDAVYDNSLFTYHSGNGLSQWENVNVRRRYFVMSSLIGWAHTQKDNPQLAYVIACLTHWGRVTHICIGNLTIIGSDNGLSPGRRQAIIWTNAGILLIEPLGTNFSENSIAILTFSFTKMLLIVSSAKWRPFCLGLNVLTCWGLNTMASFCWQTQRPWINCVILLTSFPKPFSSANSFCIDWNLNFFLVVQLKMIQHWFK